jgi:hypothetical protein
VTEAEWLVCTDPEKMLGFLQDRASERKFRLFAVAQCRRLCHWFGAAPNAESAPELGRLLDVGERAADGLANRAESEEATRLADLISGGGWSDFIGGAIGWVDARDMGTFQHPEEWAVRTLATNCVPSWRYVGTREWPDAARHAIAILVELASVKAEDADLPTAPAEQAARVDQAAWVRELFGNPFRPSPPLPPAVLAWSDGTVRRIAEGIYEERRMPNGELDTARLAILADALLDAGCDDEELIRHCRSAGPHVRGCWAVDLILGRE